MEEAVVFAMEGALLHNPYQDRQREGREKTLKWCGWEALVELKRATAEEIAAAVMAKGLRLAVKSESLGKQLVEDGQHFALADGYFTLRVRPVPAPPAAAADEQQQPVGQAQQVVQAQVHAGTAAAPPSSTRESTPASGSAGGGKSAAVKRKRTREVVADYIEYLPPRAKKPAKEWWLVKDGAPAQGGAGRAEPQQAQQHGHDAAAGAEEDMQEAAQQEQEQEPAQQLQQEAAPQQADGAAQASGEGTKLAVPQEPAPAPAAAEPAAAAAATAQPDGSPEATSSLDIGDLGPDSPEKPVASAAAAESAPPASVPGGLLIPKRSPGKGSAEPPKPPKPAPFLIPKSVAVPSPQKETPKEAAGAARRDGAARQPAEPRRADAQGAAPPVAPLFVIPKASAAVPSPPKEAPRDAPGAVRRERERDVDARPRQGAPARPPLPEARRPEGPAPGALPFEAWKGMMQQSKSALVRAWGRLQWDPKRPIQVPVPADPSTVSATLRQQWAEAHAHYQTGPGGEPAPATFAAAVPRPPYPPLRPGITSVRVMQCSNATHRLCMDRQLFISNHRADTEGIEPGTTMLLLHNFDKRRVYGCYLATRVGLNIDASVGPEWKYQVQVEPIGEPVSPLPSEYLEPFIPRKINPQDGKPMKFFEKGCYNPAGVWHLMHFFNGRL